MPCRFYLSFLIITLQGS